MGIKKGLNHRQVTMSFFLITYCQFILYHRLSIYGNSAENETAPACVCFHLLSGIRAGQLEGDSR